MASPLLEYETEMFLSLFTTDGLLITSEGLGIDRLLLHFMKLYSEEGSLVLLLNTTTPEQVGQTVSRETFTMLLDWITSAIIVVLLTCQAVTVMRYAVLALTIVNIVICSKTTNLPGFTLVNIYKIRSKTRATTSLPWVNSSKA